MSSPLPESRIRVAVAETTLSTEKSPKTLMPFRETQPGGKRSASVSRMPLPAPVLVTASHPAMAAPDLDRRRESLCHGVRAIRLAEGDEVVGVCICREGGTVLTVTENGKGRRSDIDTYRITARGGKGIRNYDVSRDKVAAVKIVDDVDDVLLSSQEGIIIRLHANEIPLQSRYGSGVRVMRLGENDKVMVLARTDHDDEAQTEKIDASEADAEPTAEQLAEMEAADAAAATEAPEADPEEKE